MEDNSNALDWRAREDGFRSVPPQAESVMCANSETPHCMKTHTKFQRRYAAHFEEHTGTSSTSHANFFIQV